ncbi:MAG: DUF2268 domain-containing putative Zn-dependent protease [Leadbetterella sp.]
MKKFVLFNFLCFVSILLNAQVKVHVEDIANFWQAYDSLKTTQDPEKQRHFIQKIYLDKGSEGVKYVMKEEGGTDAEDWLKFITSSQNKLEVIRPYTLNAIHQKAEIDSKLKYFKKIYPAFVDGEVFIVIGTGFFGGRPTGHNLVIGAEVIANSKPDWAVNMILHEYVHCQQKLNMRIFLGSCILEGMADFVAELVDQKPLAETIPSGHTAFGLKNENAIWDDFKKYIGSNSQTTTYDWLYGTKGRSINGVTKRDLGYFMGYAICKSYYQRAIDKTAAISEMINYDFSNFQNCKDFLIKSGYGSPEDQVLINNLVFGPVKEVKKEIIFKQYGYQMNTSEVMFEFPAPSDIEPKDVQSVTVAGNFNGWNPLDKSYDMKLEGNTYILKLPKSNLEMNKVYEFKFVINRDQWQPIPEYAQNVLNGNLSIEIK